MSSTVTLRQATEADYDFLYHLIVACLKEYIAATWGWDDVFQENYFASRFNPENTSVLVVEGRDVGQLTLEEKDNSIVLSQICVLPRYQGQGLGTEVIQGVLAKAEIRNCPVRLRVLKVNPARRLYERLGFVVFGETPTHYLLQTE